MTCLFCICCGGERASREASLCADCQESNSKLLARFFEPDNDNAAQQMCADRPDLMHYAEGLMRQVGLQEVALQEVGLHRAGA